MQFVGGDSVGRVGGQPPELVRAGLTDDQVVAQTGRVLLGGQVDAEEDLSDAETFESSPGTADQPPHGGVLS